MNNVKIVLISDLPRLEQLWRDIEREERPGDGEAEERAVREARQSLSVFDYLDSDSFWIFAAEADNRYVGYAAAARIPKADARTGFLGRQHFDPVAQIWPGPNISATSRKVIL